MSVLYDEYEGDDNIKGMLCEMKLLSRANENYNRDRPGYSMWKRTNVIYNKSVIVQIYLFIQGVSEKYFTLILPPILGSY